MHVSHEKHNRSANDNNKDGGDKIGDNGYKGALDVTSGEEADPQLPLEGEDEAEGAALVCGKALVGHRALHKDRTHVSIAAHADAGSGCGGTGC